MTEPMRLSIHARPTVLFVCQSNKGKSRMAEGLAKVLVGDAWEIHSAGTQPGEGYNSESAQALSEVGADMTTGRPKPVDPELLRRADRVVIIGSAAQLELPDDACGQILRWKTDEPSSRGIEGIERMRLIRDDISARIKALSTELGK